MTKYLLLFLLLSAASRVSAQTESTNTYTVDDDFPGGNIVVESIAGDTVHLHQDLTDLASGNWFYWYFRVKNASGKKLVFKFTHPWGGERKRLNVIGVGGPAISLDGGKTWDWMGPEVVDGASFSYRFGDRQDDVRFSFGMPYVSGSFDEFIKKYENHLNFEVGNLAISRAGRPIERVHVGSIHGNAKYRVVITARHHSSEMMASYVLEGIIQYFLENQTEGKWFRENVEALVIPFVDKDGVEEGDQGKNRRGRDHNRDYSGTSLYASTAALRNYVPVWSKGKLVAGIDLHCPWIRGEEHEVIHQVGSGDASIWAEQQKLSALLETATMSSALSYTSSNDLTYGTNWNTSSNTAAGSNFSNWIAGIDGVRLATTLEIPYANASGKAVTQDSARLFGNDVATALIRYLKDLEPRDQPD